MSAIDIVSKIKELMKADGISYYLVDTKDPHMSEYIGDFYKEREYISGFTGSNGTLLIGLNESFLWTDGRYFIQAEEELTGSNIGLMKMGQKSVPKLSEYIKTNVKNGETIGFNGRLISSKTGELIFDIAKENGFNINSDCDYCDLIWNDRPNDLANNIYILSDNITGEDSDSKIKRLRSKLKDKSVNGHFLSKLDDIMWLFNIRGNDIECNPVCYAYSLITESNGYIFLKDESVSVEIREYFKNLNIEILSYYDIDKILDYLNKDMAILVDDESLNYYLYSLLSKSCRIVKDKSPVELFKAIKNETEIINSKKCYLDDSVVLTKFIIWLKKEVKNSRITETEAAEKLDKMREEIPGFIELSFPTISAYGANAAKMHYEAVKGKDAVIKPEGIYLVDSGGTYFNGTTDVTRSLVMGYISDEVKMHYTLALIGMLRLQNAVFYKGATGRNLDILARGPLWEHGIDYKCGTGHGVGYILNVHEGPQSIRTLRRAFEEETPFESGMIVSDEPGVYIDGSHGIRIENILLCEDYMSTGDGDFLKFSPLTLVPVDLDAVDKKYMSDKDIENLNDYHKLVFEMISPYMSEEEVNILKDMTKKI